MIVRYFSLLNRLVADLIIHVGNKPDPSMQLYRSITQWLSNINVEFDSMSNAHIFWKYVGQTPHLREETMFHYNCDDIIYYQMDSNFH